MYIMNAIKNMYQYTLVISDRMENIKRKTEFNRLLQDSGHSNSSLYERSAIALGNTLIRLGERLQRKYTRSHQACQNTDCKYAV